MTNPKKIRLKNDPQWKGILNFVGFALILTFWPLILDRVSMLKLLTEQEGVCVRDFGYVIVAFATLVIGAIGAFAEHDKSKNQVAWLTRVRWPYLAGWFSGVIYIALMAISSPAFPGQFLPLR